MRKVITTLILVLLLGGVQALASNPFSRTGYVGNVGLSVTPQLGLGVDVTTSHGYSFGNGLWMGGGAGISFASVYDGVFIPVYAEAKYSFMPEEKVSPFIDCRLGYMTNFEDLYLLAAPSAGVDIKRISVFVQLNCRAGVRTFNLGAAFHF